MSTMQEPTTTIERTTTMSTKRTLTATNPETGETETRVSVVDYRYALWQRQSVESHTYEQRGHIAGYERTLAAWTEVVEHYDEYRILWLDMKANPEHRTNGWWRLSRPEDDEPRSLDWLVEGIARMQHCIDRCLARIENGPEWYVRSWSAKREPLLAKGRRYGGDFRVVEVERV